MDYMHGLLLYRALTPIHVGCGQDVGIVDLPVIRERTTGLSYIPGSGIRGAFRHRYEIHDRELQGQEEKLTEILFGPETRPGEEVSHAGCVAVHDAKTLLFPVRSDAEVFMWLTCPAVLERFASEVETFVPAASELAPGVRGKLADEEFVGAVALGSELHLEEFLFRIASDESVPASDRSKLQSWARSIGRLIVGAEMAEDMATRIVLVSNASFRYFNTFATDVQQHVRLNSAKVVEPGALFSLEALPPETVLYGFIGGTNSREPRTPEAEPRLSAEEVVAILRSAVTGVDGPDLSIVHLGGNESTGLGLASVAWANGSQAT